MGRERLWSLVRTVGEAVAAPGTETTIAVADVLPRAESGAANSPELPTPEPRP